MTMSDRSLARRARGLAVCAMALCGSVAQAAELDWALGAGATYSDNVARSSTNEVSDTTANLGLQLAYKKDEGRLIARVASNLQYRSYFNDSFDDELVGRFDGTVTYWFVPERFSWVAQNNFGQTYIDRAAVETPLNTQNINVFTTGPDITLRFGSRTSLLLQGRWSDVSYEDTDANNRRLEGTLSLTRGLSERSSVSLNGSAARIEFRDSTQDDGYDRQAGYLGFQVQGARTRLALTGGYTAVHDSGETFDGPLFDLSVARKMSARSTLTARVGTNLTDSADMLRLNQGIRRDAGADVDPATGINVPVDANDDVPVSRDTFQADYASVTWALAGERNAFTVVANWRQEDHKQNEGQNRKGFGANASFRRKLTPSLSGRVIAAWQTQDFVNSDIDFDEWSFGAGINWAFSRRFSMSLDIMRYEGSGATSEGDGVRDYTENRITLGINYFPGR